MIPKDWRSRMNEPKESKLNRRSQATSQVNSGAKATGAIGVQVTDIFTDSELEVIQNAGENLRPFCAVTVDDDTFLLAYCHFDPNSEGQIRTVQRGDDVAGLRVLAFWPTGEVVADEGGIFVVELPSLTPRQLDKHHHVEVSKKFLELLFKSSELNFAELKKVKS